MQVFLTVVGGVHNGRQIPIRGPEFLIGRDPKCHLRPASADVSREHCAIVLRGERVFLRDYGSSNGTILNRRMLVHGEFQLEDGDMIEVGPLTFKVTIGAAAPSKATPVEEPVGQSIHDTGDFLSSKEGEPTPEETVLVSKPKLATGPASPGDADAVLCPE